MKKNIGFVDRAVRLIAGIVLIANVLLVHDIVWNVFFLALGVFCIFEAAVSWCALYALLGKNTHSISCSVKE